MRAPCLSSAPYGCSMAVDGCFWRWPAPLGGLVAAKPAPDGKNVSSCNWPMKPGGPKWTKEASDLLIDVLPCAACLGDPATLRKRLPRCGRAVEPGQPANPPTWPPSSLSLWVQAVWSFAHPLAAHTQPPLAPLPPPPARPLFADLAALQWAVITAQRVLDTKEDLQRICTPQSDDLHDDGV